MNKGDQFIVACIPAYCEEGTIARVILSAQKYVDKARLYRLAEKAFVTLETRMNKLNKWRVREALSIFRVFLRFARG